MQRRMRALRWLLLVGALPLSACVTTEYARDPVKDQPSPESGSVVLSLTLNTGEVGQFDQMQLTRLQDDGARQSGFDQRFVLSNVAPNLSRDTSLFVGALKPGTYRIKQLVDFGTNRYIEFKDSNVALVGSFTVETGKVTDLGRVVLTAANFNVLLGRSARITSNEALIRQYASDYAALYERGPARTWDVAKNEKDIAELFALVHPIGATGFSRMSDGQIVGGTRMGTLIRRDSTGRWHVAGRTGDLEAITATTVAGGGAYRIVAGGDMGTLFAADGEKTIAALNRGNLPGGSIFFINASPDAKTWVVGVQQAKAAGLYWSSTLDNGNWQALVRDSIETSVWSGARGVWAWAYPGGVGYASTASKTVSCYDYASAQWRKGGVPDQRRLIALSASPEGILGVLTGTNAGFAGIFASTHVSRDCGQTWSETHSPYKVKAAPPIVLPSGTILEAGGVFGDPGIYASKDGQAWTKTSDQGRLSDRLWLFPELLLAVNGGALGVETIESSTDEGATWKRELSSIDYAVLRKQLGSKASPQ